MEMAFVNLGNGEKAQERNPLISDIKHLFFHENCYFLSAD